jgi:carboxyl-terminal processing protease
MNELNNLSKKKSYLSPLIVALTLIGGILLGTFFNFKPNNQGVNFSNNGNGPSDNLSGNSQSVESLLNFIAEEYVDTVDKKKLKDEAIAGLLQNLDPHSVYIPAEESKEANSALDGGFEGIGVEFNIIDDTITVINPINGGPSEKVGIMAGDKIVKVDNKVVAGIGIKNKDVFKLLRGAAETQVKMGIKRGSSKSLIPFTVTRGEIPIHSLDVAYIIAPAVGYMKFNQFSATTYKEYLEAFNTLNAQGMKKLILDLRGNSGGYLDAAFDLTDEFLPKGTMVVYTKGKSKPKEDYVATERGAFEKSPMAVLIDEGSASASEIVAGAIQDNDRGSIIGRRSFGKGLVQQQMSLPDGASIRLTVSRYYTPTGRSIQKPYEKSAKGHEDYYEDEINRYDNGELLNKDSIKQNKKLKFVTPAGKVVYGGGGITPDYFIPIDTSNRSGFYLQVFASGLVNKFCFTYADSERNNFKTKYKTAFDYNANYTVDVALYKKFVAYTEKEKINAKPASIQKSALLLQKQMKATIGRYVYGDLGFYPTLLKEDKTILKALEVLK